MKKYKNLIGISITLLMAALTVLAAYAASCDGLIKQILTIIVLVVSLPFALLVFAIDRAEEKRSKQQATAAYRRSHVRKNAMLADTTCRSSLGHCGTKK